MTDALEQSVRDYWDRVWTRGDVSAVGELYAPTFRVNSDEETVEGFAEGVASWRGHFSDFSVTVEEVFSCSDRVVSRVTYRATHVGDFTTIPATGKTIELGGIDVFEFVEGKVVQHWHETDHLVMFQQLGAELRPASG